MKTNTANTKTAILFPLLLVFYELATYLSNDAYLPALPDIANELATSDYLAQMTLTLWMLGSATMQFVLGPISDRYGRRPILLIGGVCYVVATVLCAFSHNIHLLLIARFLQGATIPAMVIAGYATVHELFDHAKAIHTLAWMTSITVLAPSFGPLFGAVIIHFANWRWVFGVLAIWSALVICGLFFVMPETNPNSKEKK